MNHIGELYMNFLFNHAFLPPDSQLLGDINSAACKLYTKLIKIDVNNLSISDYNKRYLGKKIDRLKGYLQLYSYILAWTIYQSSLPIEEIVLVDHGGGSGLLSSLAKESGVGVVVYNDIYEQSCEDAKEIGKSLCSAADYYVHGDLGLLLEFFESNSLHCNAICSFDVIEHIYDIEGFLSQIHNISDGFLSIFMSTSANPLNYRINRRLMKQHLEFEFDDRGYKYGRKPTDTTEALLPLRKKIIQEYDNILTEYEVEELARKTRGYIEADIRNSIDSFRETGMFPDGIKHPTNTCDPYTGNWFENLMDPYLLRKILENNGFESSIRPGYYGDQNGAVKNILAHGLNWVISKSHFLGIRIAPFYSLCGLRKPGITR